MYEGFVENLVDLSPQDQAFALIMEVLSSMDTDDSEDPWAIREMIVMVAQQPATDFFKLAEAQQDPDEPARAFWDFSIIDNPKLRTNQVIVNFSRHRANVQVILCTTRR